VQVVDGLVQHTKMTRDFATNQVLEVRDPLNRLTKYTYDLAGNVNSVLDPQQNLDLVRVRGDVQPRDEDHRRAQSTYAIHI
jgi:YD repeat-containing protein